LDGVVEALRLHGRLVDHARLDLIGDRDGDQQIAAAEARDLPRRRAPRRYCRWVAGLPRRRVKIHEIEISNQGAIVERRPSGRGLAAADEGDAASAAEAVDVRTHRACRPRFQAPMAQPRLSSRRIFQGLAGFIARAGPVGAFDERGHSFDLVHPFAECNGGSS